MSPPSTDHLLAELLASSMALSCGLASPDGRLLAHATAPGGPDAAALASTAARLGAAAGHPPDELLVSWAALKLLSRPAGGSLAFVLFDHRSSLPLVRIRLAEAFGPLRPGREGDGVDDPRGPRWPFAGVTADGLQEARGPAVDASGARRPIR